MVRVPRMSVLVVLDGATEAARYLLAGAFYGLVVGAAAYGAIKGAGSLAGAGLPALTAIVFDDREAQKPVVITPAAASPAVKRENQAALATVGRFATLNLEGASKLSEAN